MKCWRVVLYGVECFTTAVTVSRAKRIVVCSAAEAGYGTVAEGFRQVRAFRAPKYDGLNLDRAYGKDHAERLLAGANR